MDKTTNTLCESIVPLPGAVALPPLPWDLDTTNARLTIPIKVGELVDALHRWGREVYASAQAAPEDVRNQALTEVDEAIRAVLWQVENGDGLRDEVYGVERCRDAIRALRTSTDKGDDHE